MLALLLFIGAMPRPLATAAVTIQDERELGESLLVTFRQQFKLLDEPDISSYIRDLGREILEVAGHQPFDYQFYVINNQDFNAFAAPSGLIFIHSGLIEASDSEGELVSVLAHEVGHAASRHYADRTEKMKRVSLGTTAVALAGMLLGGGSALGEAAMAGSVAGGATLGLQFSRRDEEEADRLSFKWMQEMGRDPAEMLGMLRKMRKISRFRRGQLPPYLLTHPEPEQRLAYIEDRLRMDGAELKPAPPANDDDFAFAFHRVRQRIFALTRSPQELIPALRHRLRQGDRQAADFMAHFGLAQAYTAERRHEQALAEINKVIDRFPQHAILLADRGVINFEAGRRQQALDDLAQARQREPDDPFIIYQQARIFQQLNQNDRARPLYERLLELTPDHARLHDRYGRLRSEQGERAAGHYHLGLYHWYDGNLRSARYHLKEAVKVAGDEQPEIARQAREQLDKIARSQR
ncbi:MAG: M48 family metalloprotease [Desulfurivibrio sp.]|nr:M48 family metalloprotease [Desulfurivibrio sp.]